MYFDPIGNRLGLQGYVNDKTLGDQTLTAAPPPAYIDPNILRPTDLDLLKKFKADSGETETMEQILGSDGSWTKAVDALYSVSRNPGRLRSDPG